MPSISSRSTAAPPAPNSEANARPTPLPPVPSGFWGAQPVPIVSTTLRCPLPNVGQSSTPDNLRQYYAGGAVPQYRFTPPTPLASLPLFLPSTVVNNITSNSTNITSGGGGGGGGSTTIIFTRGGTILSPTTTINVVIWYAPFSATITNVLGYTSGTTGSVINARRNGSLTLLTSNLTLSSADVWIDGGAVQNTAISAGDKIEMMIVSVSGSPTEIAIEVQCTRTT